jgi:hypothetical protein
MNFRNHVGCSRLRHGFVLAALIVAVPFLSTQALAQAPSPQAQPAQDQKPQTQPPQAKADGSFGGPSFRKGLWRFVRTLDIVRNANKNVKYRLVDREMTRCVDPTQAMKATFSSAPVGSCVSDKPEKVGNKYTFGHRCDYMGAVSTVITVLSDEAYTEVNEISGGEHPRTDRVTAKRIGDCNDDKAEDPARSSVSSLQH